MKEDVVISSSIRQYRIFFLICIFYLSIVDLTCNVSGTQQSDSVIHIYIYYY